MTEIENILNRVPYDFLKKDADEKYKGLTLLHILKEKVNDGIVFKEAIIVDENDKLYVCNWALDFIADQILIEEIIPIDWKTAILKILKSQAQHDIIDAIQRTQKDS